MKNKIILILLLIMPLTSFSQEQCTGAGLFKTVKLAQKTSVCDKETTALDTNPNSKEALVDYVFCIKNHGDGDFKKGEKNKKEIDSNNLLYAQLYMELLKRVGGLYSSKDLFDCATLVGFVNNKIDLKDVNIEVQGKLLIITDSSGKQSQLTLIKKT